MFVPFAAPADTRRDDSHSHRWSQAHCGRPQRPALPCQATAGMRRYGPVARDSIVRVGVLGAGAWARAAHLPGYLRDPRCRVVAIADTDVGRAREAARDFDISTAASD